MPFKYLSSKTQNRLMQAANGLTVMTLVLGLLLTYTISYIVEKSEAKNRISYITNDAASLNKSIEMSMMNSTLRLQTLFDFYLNSTQEIKQQKRIVEQVLKKTIFQRMTVVKFIKKNKDNLSQQYRKILTIKSQDDNLMNNNNKYLESINLISKINILSELNLKSTFLVNNYNNSHTLHLIIRSNFDDETFLIFSTTIEKFLTDLNNLKPFFLIVSDEILKVNFTIEKSDKADKIQVQELHLDTDLDQWLKNNHSLSLINNTLDFSSLKFTFVIQDTTNLSRLTWLTFLSGVFITLLLALFIRFIAIQNKRTAKLVVERTIDLETALEQAKEANLFKNRFIANISHELRTPLNIILGMIEIVENQIQDAKLSSYIKAIHSSSDQLMSLISDLLDVAQKNHYIENQETKSIPIKCPQYFDEIIKMIESTAQEKKLTVKYNLDESVPACIKGDPIQLRQILINLLRNSIKYTISGFVKLDISVHKTENINGSVKSTLKFSIIDTGVGIPQSKKHQIFERFMQLESTKLLSQGGVGLGLSIVQDLVNKLNGNIEVDSEVGKGSTFSVYLTFDVIENENWNTYLNKKLTEKENFYLVTNKSEIKTEFEKEILKITRKLTKISEIDFNVKIKNNEINKQDVYFISENKFQFFNSCPNKFVNNLIYLTNDLEDQELIKKLNLKNIKSLDVFPVLYNDLFIIINGKASEAKQKDFEFESTSQNLEIIEKSNECTILIADDDASNRQLYKAYFDNFNIKILEAENGMQAFEIYLNQKIDFLIADLRMPVSDGIDLTSKIRNHEFKNNLEQVPIVLVTADALKETSIKAHNAGVSKFLTKPIRKQILLETLNELKTK